MKVECKGRKVDCNGRKIECKGMEERLNVKEWKEG